jgi:hypothetical protein
MRGGTVNARRPLVAHLLRGRFVPWPVRLRRWRLAMRLRRRRAKTDPRWIVTNAIALWLAGRESEFATEIHRAVDLLPVTGSIDRERARHLAADIARRTGTAQQRSVKPISLEHLPGLLTTRGWKQLQRMLGYCGLFPDAVAAYRVALHEVGANVQSTVLAPASDPRLRALVAARTPVIVGKATDRLSEDWSAGPIVRLNIINLPPSDLRQRCDVLYLNSGQSQTLDSRLLAGDPAVTSLVQRTALFGVGRGSLLRDPERLLTRTGSPPLPFGGALLGIRAIHDMLEAGAATVHLVGFDFYLTAAIRKSNHAMCAQLGSAVIWGQLDWVQRLHREGRVTADAAGLEVLTLSLEQYAERVESLYGDWSGERMTR